MDGAKESELFYQTVQAQKATLPPTNMEVQKCPFQEESSLLLTAKTYVLPATARKRVPDTSKKLGRRSKTALPSPPSPTPASCSIPPSWSAVTFAGHMCIYIYIYCYHQNNPQSKPEKPASDAPDSQLQAGLNPRNPIKIVKIKPTPKRRKPKP